MEMPEHLGNKREAMNRSHINPDANLLLLNNQKTTIKFFQNLWEIRHYFNIFNGTIKTIEGKFGSGIGSYFRFWNFLLNMNIIILLPW